MNAPRYVWVLVAAVLALVVLILLFRFVDFHEDDGNGRASATIERMMA